MISFKNDAVFKNVCLKGPTKFLKIGSIKFEHFCSDLNR